jgi:BirA family biotin operon repressor/biotin-[acetyl-CoA-carboxylase] ligase
MRLSVDRFQEDLRSRRFGRKIVFLREVGSTNDFAKELASYGAVEGTVVVAETQTAGRGRHGGEWVSPRGGLYFSVVIRPEPRSAEAVGLVFVSGLAVAEVLSELCGLKVETKWPNDVLVNGKKVCGILSEMNTTGEKVNYAVVGVGLNANIDVESEFPERLKAVATSLEKELHRRIRLEDLFRALLERLDCVYEQFLKEGFSPVLRRWERFAGFLDCRVEVTSGTEKCVGLALDVEADGSLVVRLNDGTVKRFLVGDVSLRQG